MLYICTKFHEYISKGSSAHHLIMLYIDTKFRKNISLGFRVIERTTEIFKWVFSVKNVGGVAVLNLCISADDA